MTSLSTPAPFPGRPRALPELVPRLLGYLPRESVVLVPLRDGAPTGALRFALPSAAPGPAARAFIGALGRFGRAESAVAALYTDRPQQPSTRALLIALREGARRVGLGELEVLHPPTDGPRPRASGGECDGGRGDCPLPAVERALAGAVAGEVDALLDRHPSARLPERLCASVDAALRRAASGRPGPPTSATLAALIVAAQRPEWVGRAMGLVSPGLGEPIAPAVTALVAAAAAAAPRTERAPLLVLLAVLEAGSGRAERGLELARWAARMEPRDPLARRAVVALEAGVHAAPMQHAA